MDDFWPIAGTERVVPAGEPWGRPLTKRTVHCEWCCESVDQDWNGEEWFFCNVHVVQRLHRSYGETYYWGDDHNCCGKFGELRFRRFPREELNKCEDCGRLSRSVRERDYENRCFDCHVTYEEKTIRIRLKEREWLQLVQALDELRRQMKIARFPTIRRPKNLSSVGARG